MADKIIISNEDLNESISLKYGAKFINISKVIIQDTKFYVSDKEKLDTIFKTGKIKLKNKELKSAFNLGGFSLWRAIEHLLEAGCFGFKVLTNDMQIINNIFYIIKKEKPKIVYASKQEKELNKVLKRIGRKEGFKIEIINKPSITFKKIKNVAEVVALFCLKKIRFFMRKFFFVIKLAHFPKDVDVCFLVSENKQEIPDFKNDKFIKGYKKDMIAHYLKGKKIIAISYPFAYNMGVRENIEQKDMIPIESFFRIYDLFKVAGKWIEFNIKWKKLRKSFVYSEIKYKGIPLNNFLLGKIDFFFKVYLWDTLLEFYSLKNMLKKEKIKSLVSFFFRSGSFGRMATFLAQKNKTKVIEILHGNPGDSVSHFQYKEDIDRLNQGRFPTIPYADIVCVFGEDQKDYLIKNGNIPEKNISITGNPVYDIFFQRIKKIRKEDVIKKLGIKDKDKKIVLFTSTKPLKNFNERIKIRDILIREFSKHNNLILLIKPHPRERDLEFYEKAIGKANAKNIKLVKDGNLYEMLSVAYLHITSCSSAILEASIGGVPTIIIDLFKSDYKKWYGNHRALISVENENEFDAELNKLVNNKFYYNNIRTELKDFIEKFRFDGKSSLRIANVINNSLKAK